jgi:hypothetical protein
MSDNFGIRFLSSTCGSIEKISNISLNFQQANNHITKPIHAHIISHDKVPAFCIDGSVFVFSYKLCLLDFSLIHAYNKFTSSASVQVKP